MTAEDIGKKINPEFPGVYAVTTAPTKLIYKNGSVKVGYFDFTRSSDELAKQNKYTFIEFGENSEQYRISRDDKYVTVVNGNELEDVEYPSYSDHLLNRLKKISITKTQKNETEVSEYKQRWVSDINKLLNQITNKWLERYSENEVAEFSFLPVKRDDSYVGEYLTMILEMEFGGFQYIVLEPVSAYTSEFNGRLDLYKRGDIYNKYPVFRKLVSDTEVQWVIALTTNPRDHKLFSQQELESLISKWIQ